MGALPIASATHALEIDACSTSGDVVRLVPNVKPHKNFAICQPDNTRMGGTAPHVGPRRRAVVMYRHRWYPAPVDLAQGWDGDLWSAIQWCLSLGWIGTEVRCVGSRRADARIGEPWSYRKLLEVAEGIRHDGLDDDLPMTARMPHERRRVSRCRRR